MKPSNCLECGHRLVGRTDKKYCSVNCRNRANNRRYRQEQQVYKRFERALRRNYFVLQELKQSGTIEVDHALLNQMGFDFNLSTRKEGSDGSNRYFVFNLGLEKLKGQSYRLIHQNSHGTNETTLSDS